MPDEPCEHGRPVLRFARFGLFTGLMLAAPLAWGQAPGSAQAGSAPARNHTALVPLTDDELAYVQGVPLHWEFRNQSLGAVLVANIDTSDVGDALLGDLGAESIGIRSFGSRSWLVQWDALLAGRAGVLANEHPFMPLAGAHERGDVEVGSRFLPLEHWSPYVGLGLNTDLTVLTEPGVPIGNLWKYNNSDGVGGLTVNGGARVAVGASLLTPHHSLLLEAFFQEALRAPEINAPGAAFAEGGVAARWDISGRLTLRVQGLAGRTPAVLHAGLDYTVQTVHAEVDADFRKIFGNGMWLGAQVQVWQELSSTTYLSGRTYPAADTPTFIFSLVYGIPFEPTGKARGVE
jgi:hypothetical protein